MFLGYQGNKIVLTANTREELVRNKFIHLDKVEETDIEYTLYNGEYLTPEEKETKEKQAHKKELMTELDALDLKCIRALRAIQAGTGTQADIDKLAELESQAEEIRRQIQELGE